MAKDFYTAAEKNVARELRRRIRRERRRTCLEQTAEAKENRAYAKALAKAAFIGDVTDEALRKKARLKTEALGIAIAMTPVLLALGVMAAYVLSGPTGTDSEIAKRSLDAFFVGFPVTLLLTGITAGWSIELLEKAYVPVENRILDIRKKGEVPLVEALRKPNLERELHKMVNETARSKQDIKKLRKEQQLW